MKNSADRGGCYPPRPKAEVDNTIGDVILTFCRHWFNMTVQLLVMVNYACGFTQSEMEIYFG